jgi:hypothetical protein
VDVLGDFAEIAHIEPPAAAGVGLPQSGTPMKRVRFKKRQRRLSEYNARRRCVTNWP